MDVAITRRLLEVAFRWTWVALAAMLFVATSESRAAGAPPTPMTNAEAAALCRDDNNLPWSQQQAEAMPGYWYDHQKQRGAISWDLVWNDNRDALKVIVYTYDENRRPIWLATKMRTVAGNTWTGQLYRYTSTTAGTGTVVGGVAITFFAGDPTKLAMRWDWDSYVAAGAPQQNECLTHFTIGSPLVGSKSCRVPESFRSLPVICGTGFSPVGSCLSR